MGRTSDLEGLQILQTDLLAASELRLLNVDRLWVQLEARLEDFRNLLDKLPRNEESRKCLTSGTITLSEVEYRINEEFQQNTLQLADTLNLDEIEAARIILEVQEASVSLGRTTLESAVIRFHLARSYMLECLRLVLLMSIDVDMFPEDGSTLASSFRKVASVVLDTSGRVNASAFFRKTLQAMADISSWLQSLADKVSSASILGQGQKPELVGTIEYQRVSLVRQHESLGMIVYYLVKDYTVDTAEFERMLDVVRRADKYDNLLVHYFPAVGAFITTIAVPEGLEIGEARALNQRIVASSEQKPWTLPYVQAAVTTWWLAEYSGRYTDGPVDPSLVNTDLVEESRLRSRHFTEALKNGAFDFILSLSADAKSSDWIDPARLGLRQWLQRKAPPLIPDSVQFSPHFHDILMEQLESFVDAFITNMPDVLRKLRIDEDEQRQLSQTHEHDLDLERFLVIISFAFEGRPDAGQVFWSDPESNLAGFLQWASRRASTPLVSAFCEMLQSISENEECATAAHYFLLDEGTSTSGKMRRSQSLTWNQIIKELEFFSSKIRDRPSLPQSNIYRGGKTSSDQAEAEPESEMMLESYLRLISQLCTASASVRTFLLKHPTFHLTELLYQLSSSLIPSRLRACAFTTIRSLTSHKTREIGEYVWISLDSWISGGYSPGMQTTRNSQMADNLWAMESIFQEIAGGFEEPNAFIQLLESLVAPYEIDSELYDGLPFPETLGSLNRMPGIDPYVDFVLGQVFGATASDVNDKVHLRLLRLTCLNFISTCLSTFNEDLVVFANISGIAVDNAVKASDLKAYVHLHPFARVMEWIFNDRVMTALFETIHQDAAEVAKSSPESPLILCLVRSIEVATAVFEKQSTYLNIVRPAIRLEPTVRRSPVANSAYASFEDGVLNNLSIIVDLGLYVGAGHPTLTIASIRLLEQLSTSSKLTSPPVQSVSRHLNRNKAIAALEANNDADVIARSLLNELNSTTDIEVGMNSSSYAIKLQILDFLIACLETTPDHPTIAHLLLGFQCGSNSVEVIPGSPFAKRESIFFAAVDFVTTGTVGADNSSFMSWFMTLKDKALYLLRILWRSPLTSYIVMSALQSNDFLTNMIVNEVFVDGQSTWDGKTIYEDDFVLSTSADCLCRFLRCRTIALQYITLELRQLTQEPSPALKKRVLMTLFGSTITDEGQQIQHFTAFDFFDFMELEMPSVVGFPRDGLHSDLNFEICKIPCNETSALYDLKWAKELMALRKSELRANGQLAIPQDEATLDEEARFINASLVAENHLVELNICRNQALEAWAQLMVMMIKMGDIQGTNQIEFILRTLQMILPKLERYSLQSLNEALQLANLARILLFSIDFQEGSIQKGELAHLISDRLYELFRICLRAIHSPIANSALKETLYCICWGYLMGTSVPSHESTPLRRHSTQTIKAAGEKLIDVVCDDAYVGEETCRTSALLLLSSFVTLARQESSKYIVDALIRLNFVELLVDSLKNMSDEIRDVKREDINMLLSHYNVKLDLLLQICRTRFGASAVLSAGLFRFVKESQLFSTDPDIGIDIDERRAVDEHYKLLIALMRVINAAVLSRGSQHQQTIAQGRRFLSEHRLSLLAVFKRSSNLGMTSSVVPDETVEELVELYMYLITMTDYLDFADEGLSRRPNSMTFT